MQVKFSKYFFLSSLFFFFFINDISAQSGDAFKKALHFADSVYRLKEYENAKSAYEYAARFQANNAIIQSRLSEIQRILDQQAAVEKQYNTAVSDAKKAFFNNDADAAYQYLKTAVTIKSDPDSWANQKLKEIEDGIAAKEKLQQEYNEQIALGNKIFSENKYEDAEKAFSAALKLVPNDATATQKLSEVRAKIKERNAAYLQCITEGDRLYQSDQVSEAKILYQKALEQKPEESYPQQRIDFINNMLAEEADLENRVKAVVKEADQLFTASDYEPSYLKYQAALDVYPGHQHAKERMKEIDSILGEARALQRAYDQAIVAADQLFSAQRYKEAKIEYEKAGGLKPSELYPTQKINEIEVIFAKLQSDEDTFNKLVAAGDQMYGDSLFEDAKNNYTEALKMKPDHADVKQKLADANTQIAKIEKEYASLIIQADNQLRLKKFIDAQLSYERASSLKPNVQYPKDQIADIQKTLIGKRELLEQNYQDAMSAGNQLLESGNFAGAKDEFTKAARIKPDEQEPKDKLKAVDQAIVAQKQTDAQFAALLKEGDSKYASKRWSEALTAFQNAYTLKNDAAVKTKMESCESEIAKAKGLENQFNQFVSDGDQFFAESKWNEAKTAYLSAAAIKSDRFLTDKIKEIDSKLAQELAVDNQFKKLIDDANDQLDLKKYIDAQVLYEAALNLKPAEKYPQEQLTAIAGILKDKQELLDKSYAEALTNGDAYLEAKDFTKAKAEYTKAASIKPKEQTPKDKLSAIDQAIANQKQIDAQFADFVKNGDAKFASKLWAEALTAFNNAYALKNDETVKTKITSCENEISKAKNLEEQFNQLVMDGNSFFAAKNWNNAKSSYQAALQLKSDKSLTDKIKEIDIAIQKEADLEKQYQSLIAIADAKMAEKQWKIAIDNYRNALNVKPEDAYALDKISISESQLRAEQELDAKFQNFVSQGDAFMQQNSLDEAKVAYQSALTIKENADYPRNQLAVIEMKQQDYAKRRANYETLLANAESDANKAAWKQAKNNCSQAMQLFPDEDRPKELMQTIDAAIAQIEATEAAYNDAIAHAEAALSQQNREIALQQYEKAAQIKPEELYPKNKINEINAIILAEENREKDRQYQVFIDEANNFLSTKSYEEAISKFESALGIKPNDEFATNKLEETRATIQRLAQIETDYAQFVKDGDAQFNGQEYEEALASYQKAAALKPEETYPKEQISKAQYQIDFSPERRNLLAQESYNKGVEAMNQKKYQTASNAFATATMWYPEDISATQEALSQMRETLMSGKSKTILNEKIEIAANQTYNVKTFVALGDLDPNAFIIIKVSGDFEKNTNIFLRYGRYTVTYGNSILVAVAKANVAYYCVSMKGDKNDINWMTIMPENNDITIEEITLVSPK